MMWSSLIWHPNREVWDHPFAEKRGIKAILAPSLPGIVAPKTAGQIFGGDHHPDHEK